MEERSQVDQELAKRALARDFTAYRTIVDRYKAEVHFIIAGLVGEDKADELFPDVFGAVFSALPRYGSSDLSFKNWFLLTVLEYCLAYLQSVSDCSEENSHFAFDACQGIPFKGEILRRFIASKTSAMDLKNRAVLTLSGIRSVTRMDVSEITGLELEEVKHRLSWARKDLAGEVRSYLGRGGQYHCNDTERCPQARYCVEAELMFEKFVDVELDWIEKLTLISHLRKCRRCRMTLSDLDDVITALRMPEVYAVPKEPVERILTMLENRDRGSEIKRYSS